MKTIQPFAYDDTFGIRFYEGGEQSVGYISLRILYKVCEDCDDHDCEYCARTERDSSAYYMISTKYPLEGFDKDEFHTEIDNMDHVYYTKVFEDANEAVTVFMNETLKKL